MAILPALPGVEVRVVVGGEPAREWPMPYDPEALWNSEHPEVPRTINYIESMSGSRFSVTASLYSGHGISDPAPAHANQAFPEGTDMVAFRVTIDGVFFHSFGIYINETDTKVFGDRYFRMPNGNIRKQFPVFSNIITTEEASRAAIEADTARIRTLGKIDIVVSAIQVTGEMPNIAYPNDSAASPDMEVAMKVHNLYAQHLTHATQYEEEPQDGTPGLKTYNKLATLGEFQFQYSSHRPVVGRNGFTLAEPMPAVESTNLLPQHHYPEEEMADGTPMVDLTGNDE
ncbi:hypothetical protein F53441_6881 [Fusarium austroafricanum]|uniref:DUF7918 domain-containing protein n=1 Tax=Fusarium austroafricanum TaxID=2364996 RepID=A0A8H4KEY2_9HYPO|nr:hypothetical protein F53441_6881 [Fusarium austroafricanum]